MTYDPPALSLTEEYIEDLHEEYSEYLIEAAPADWRRLRYTVYATVDHHAYRSIAVTADSSEVPFHPSVELLELFHPLRNSMYEPGRGTWLTAIYEFDRDGEPSFTFDYDSQPPAEMNLSAEDYANDFEYFPRDTAHIPDWLAEQLDAAGRDPGWYIPNQDNAHREPKPIDFIIRITEGHQKYASESIRSFISEKYLIKKAEPYNTARSVEPWHTDPYRDPAILMEIGRYLQQGVPNGWESLTYTYTEAGLCKHGTLRYLSADGTQLTIRHPLPIKERLAAVHGGRRDLAEWSEGPLHELLSKHRRSTYQTGKGAWFTATYSLESSGRFTIAYEYDGTPKFIPKLSARMYAFDLSSFPRDAEHMPQWLLTAAEVSATDPSRLI